MRRATSHQEDAVIDTSRPTDSSSPSSSFTPPPTMLAVVTLGNGGYDKLSYQRVATPEPGPGEVLLRVLAARHQQYRDQYPPGLVFVQRHERYPGVIGQRPGRRFRQ